MEMIVAIILAAGLSKRFPGNKLLFPWEGVPIIRRTVLNVLRSSVSHIVIVLGHDHERIKSVLRDLDEKILFVYSFVYNEKYFEGMNNSVKKGVSYALEKFNDKIEAIIIAPGDTAWAAPEAYDMIINAFRESDRKIVVAAYNGRRSHPILFGKELLPEILIISEETRGLKMNTNKYRNETLVVETPYPGVILDIDTYNDSNSVKYILKK
jgi:molybdenum cofactor cytidylyltransferase